MGKKNLAAAAQAVTNQFFSSEEDPQESTNEVGQTAKESYQEAPKQKSIKQKTNEQTRKKTADPVKVFSFRGLARDVDQWRMYASIRGVKVDEIGSAAMQEYIKRHPLSAEEKALFDKRLEILKS